MREFTYYPDPQTVIFCTWDTSNYDFCTENIYSFLSYHLHLAHNVKSYIKDTNRILKKIKEFGQLSEGPILRAFDVVGL